MSKDVPWAERLMPQEAELASLNVPSVGEDSVGGTRLDGVRSKGSGGREVRNARARTGSRVRDLCDMVHDYSPKNRW